LIEFPVDVRMAGFERLIFPVGSLVPFAVV